MNTHLIVYIPASTGEDRLRRFLSFVNRYGSLKDWSATRRVTVDDVALFYYGHPHQAIVAVGMVATEPRVERGRFDWTRRRAVPFCDFNPMWALENPLRLPDVQDQPELRRWYRGRPYRGSRILKPKVADLLLREIVRLNPTLPKLVEGGGRDRVPMRQRTTPVGTNGLRYEEGLLRELATCVRTRSGELRAAAIATYGYDCRVCGFNFRRTYGEYGAGYVEVHHIRPLAGSTRARANTVRDVITVCSNCHRTLHKVRRKPLLPPRLRRAVLTMRRHA